MSRTILTAVFLAFTLATPRLLAAQAAPPSGHWEGSFSGPTVDQLTQYLSIIEHFDDFSKGIVDTTHLIYYFSLITFGLFLTARSVDTERWRG